MTYKQTFLAAITASLLATQGFAAPASTTLTGIVNVSNATYSDLKVMGTLDASDLKVNSLNVMGPADIEDFTATSVTIMGPAELEHGVMKELTINGALELEDSTVTGLTKVMGKSKIKASKLGAAEFNGRVEAKHSEFSGDVVVVGNMKADDCNFKKLTATSKELKLRDVNVASIFIKDNKGTKPQIVILEGKTVVDAAITFERPGIVKVKSKKVSYGKIENAEIKK